MPFVGLTQKILLTTTLRCVRTYGPCSLALTGMPASEMNLLASNILPSVEQQFRVDKVAQMIKGPTIMFCRKTSPVSIAQSAAGRLLQRRLD
jgi:hypothetical protein